MTTTSTTQGDNRNDWDPVGSACDYTLFNSSLMKRRMIARTHQQTTSTINADNEYETSVDDDDTTIIQNTQCWHINWGMY